MGEALFVYADRNELGILNTSQYRVLIPAKYLNKAGHKIVTETGGSITNVYGHKADTINYSHVPEVVLLERVVWPGRIEKLRLAGARRIIITFDDNYQLLPPGAASEYWKRNYGDFVKCLGLVDEVIVPSVALAADYSKLCKKISVVENYLDPDLWQAKTKYDNHPLTIGWGGSNQHVATWANKHFSSALREIQRLYGDKIRIVVYGDAAVSALSDGNVEFESRYLVPFDEWPKHCAQFDIGLAPLYGVYDERRSNLKVIEYCAAGVPFVATDGTPYRGLWVGSHVGKTNETRGWIAALDKIIQNYPSEVETMQTSGAEIASEYMMNNGVHRYEEILFNA